MIAICLLEFLYTFSFDLGVHFVTITNWKSFLFFRMIYDALVVWLMRCACIFNCTTLLFIYVRCVLNCVQFNLPILCSAILKLVCQVNKTQPAKCLMAVLVANYKQKLNLNRINNYRSSYHCRTEYTIDVCSCSMFYLKYGYCHAVPL